MIPKKNNITLLNVLFYIFALPFWIIISIPMIIMGFILLLESPPINTFKFIFWKDIFKKKKKRR